MESLYLWFIIAFAAYLGATLLLIWRPRLRRWWKRWRSRARGRGGRVTHLILKERLFDEQLVQANQRITRAAPGDIPELFSELPLDVFGLLLLELPPEYPELRRYFPRMPSEELQLSWVGASGEELLRQSVAAVKSFVAGYEKYVGRPIENANVLDYGCGWGRLLRLFYKYVPETALFGVDAWPQILDTSRALGMRGQLGLIDEYPETLPFHETKFGLIYSFSILTHLSARAQAKALALWHRSLSDDGLVAVTIRPKAYWTQFDPSEAAGLMAQHDMDGFAYKPHDRPSSHGDIPYGDASIDIEYIRRNWHGWKIVGLDYSLVDICQLIIFLKKAPAAL